MDSPVVVIVGPSPLKWLFALLASCCAFTALTAAALFLLAIAHPKANRPIQIQWGIVEAAAAISVCCVGTLALIAVVANKPRVEIGMDGFVRRTVFGTRSRRWSDIKGEFAVVWVGPIRAIAYCVTPQFREAAGIKPQPLLKGYDEDITGAYSISLVDLAELLNEHKRHAKAS